MILTPGESVRREVQHICRLTERNIDGYSISAEGACKRWLDKRCK